MAKAGWIAQIDRGSGLIGLRRARLADLVQSQSVNR